MHFSTWAGQNTRRYSTGGDKAHSRKVVPDRGRRLVRHGHFFGVYWMGIITGAKCKCCEQGATGIVYPTPQPCLHHVLGKVLVGTDTGLP